MSLQRTLSRPVTNASRAQSHHDAEPFVDSNGFLAFGPGDPENPQNWTTRHRVRVTGATILLVVNATFASSTTSGCLPSISEDFNVSNEAAGLTITLFLLGYCAGPLIFAPLSEFYGRRWIFYSTFSLYLIFNFLCAWAPNFGSLLVGRFLTGTFISAPLTNGPGLLADVWNPLERGNAMAAFSSMLYIGPALGPVVGGFIQLRENWRWTFYVLLWMGAGSFLLMLTIPETYGPTLLLRKAQRIRAAKVPGYENVQAPIESGEKNLKDIYKVALIRPWIILFDPISFLAAIYMSVVYTLLYMLFTIYPIVFQEKRGWNAGVGELPLIGTAIGAVCGGVIVLLDTRRRMKQVQSGEKAMTDFTPEDRMVLGMIGGVGFPITMFWFAWTAEYDSIHWIVPTIAGGCLSASILLIFVAYLTYIIDSYLMYAASALAANTIARSACGAAAPLFTNQMFKALGVGGGGSLIGGVATLLAIIPFAFYKYGAGIRMRSKFAPVKQKEQLKEKDEERGITPAAGAGGVTQGTTSSPLSTTNTSNSEHSSTTAHDGQHRGDGYTAALGEVPTQTEHKNEA